jgi:hypothetical protein
MAECACLSSRGLSLKIGGEKANSAPYVTYAFSAGVGDKFYVVGGCQSQPSTGPDCRIGTTGNMEIYGKMSLFSASCEAATHKASRAATQSVKPVVGVRAGNG